MDTIYTSKPTARAARIAWDRLQARRPTDPVVRLWRAYLDYWCWVCRYQSSKTADLDGLEVAKAATPRRYASISATRIYLRNPTMSRCDPPQTIPTDRGAPRGSILLATMVTLAGGVLGIGAAIHLAGASHPWAGVLVAVLSMAGMAAAIRLPQAVRPRQLMLLLDRVPVRIVLLVLAAALVATAPLMRSMLHQVI